VQLLFADSLKMDSGSAYVPAMVWKATKESLFVYAVKNCGSLQEDTLLYHAPFFNIYRNGNVCMGTVDIDISNDCLLEDFIGQWQDYFFGSYFSHLIQEHNPVKSDIKGLWESLVNTGKKFPLPQLVKNGLTLKNLLQ
jgi:PRTRC genetic system protein B